MKRSLLILFAILTSQLCIAAQWELSNSGITNGYIPSLAQMGSDIFLCTMGSGVYISSDQGKSWSPRNNGLEDNDFIKCITVSNNIIYAVTSSNLIYKSSDKGLNWIKTTNTFDTIGIYVVYSNGNDVFVGTSGGGVFLTTDEGLTWIQKNEGLASKYVYNFIVDGTDIYAGTATWVFKSTNYGGTWELKNNGLENKYPHGMTKFGSILFVGTEDGIFTSSDKGESWINRSNGLTDQESRWVYDFEYIGSYIFAATLNGVYVSSDTGRSWILKNIGMENIGVYSLKIINDYLIAGSSSMKGLYRIKYSDLLTGIEEEKFDGTSFTELQAYYHRDKVNIEIPETLKNQPIMINIFDILGNKFNVYGEDLISTGDNFYQIDTRLFSEGIYFGFVQTGQYAIPLKFIVIK